MSSSHHEPAGNAPYLCSRRSSGRGHFLCKQWVTEVPKEMPSGHPALYAPDL